MKNYATFLCLVHCLAVLLVSHYSKASNEIDSIFSLIDKAEYENKKACHYNSLSYLIANASPEKSEAFAEKALRYAKNSNDTLEQIKALHNLAVSYLLRSSFDKSEKVLGEALFANSFYRMPSQTLSLLEASFLLELEKSNMQAAKHKLDSSLKVLKDMSAAGQDKDFIQLKQADYFENKALLEIRKGNANKALLSINEALRLHSLRKDYIRKVSALLKAAEIFLTQNKLTKTKDYLNEAENLNKTSHSIDNELRVMEMNIKLMAAYGSFKTAYVLQEKLAVRKDSLLDLVHELEIDQLQEFYNAEKAMSEGQIEQRSNKEKQEILTSYRVGTAALGIVALLSITLGLVLYFSGKSRRKSYSMLTELNAEVQRQNKKVKANEGVLKKAYLNEKKSNVLLKKMNQELKEKRELIAFQKAHLQDANKKISAINSGLEAKVKNRTEELQNSKGELDTFLYRSSHDLRRPLTTLLGLVNLARLTNGTATPDLLKHVERTARQMDKMLIKLHMVSEINSSGSAQEIISSDPEKLVRSAINHHKEILEDKKCEFEYNNPSGINPVVHPGLLKIVFMNLVENAFTFNGGRDARIVLSVTEVPGGKTCLKFKDYGVGIPNSMQSEVFKMYFRGHDESKGNGLGLYVAKKAVTEMGGSIELSSKERSHTEVSVFLPKV